MTDERFERWIALLLRAGVLTAAAVVLIGGVWHLATNGHDIANYRVFHPDDRAGANGLAVIRFGLLILIATPVARVAVSIIAFGLERDWIYVGITALVLAILLYGLL